MGESNGRRSNAPCSLESRIFQKASRRARRANRIVRLVREPTFHELSEIVRQLPRELLVDDLAAEKQPQNEPAES